MSKSITVNDFLTEAHDHQRGKVCTKCKEHKPLSKFSKQKDGKNGIRPYCKSCAKVDHDNMCRFKVWFSSKKARVKYNGNAEFTIEPEDIPGVKIKPVYYNDTLHHRKTGIKSWEAIEYSKVCPVLGIELDWGMNGIQPNSPSLDRIDPTKGYIPGNVMIMSTLANRMKQNATPEQLKQFCRYHLFGE